MQDLYPAGVMQLARMMTGTRSSVTMRTMTSLAPQALAGTGTLPTKFPYQACSGVDRLLGILPCLMLMIMKACTLCINMDIVALCSYTSPFGSSSTVEVSTQEF